MVMGPKTDQSLEKGVHCKLSEWDVRDPTKISQGTPESERTNTIWAQAYLEHLTVIKSCELGLGVRGDGGDEDLDEEQEEEDAEEIGAEASSSSLGRFLRIDLI
ncbi:hypothetical protein L218DRAFT_942111 [Marasmius fiardii PR-910]|nr:hypothetical protein L218DRAFT_942111 [Marasmius fiardii PR-910]